MQKTVSAILDRVGLPVHGVCAYADVAAHLLPCRAAERLRAIFEGSAPRCVLVGLFPYRFSHDRPSPLARYARVPDYHVVAGEVLTQAAEALRQAFPDHRFFASIDNSPLPEVRAAALAGLGCVGDNGLLIHPVYGSYVVIGTVVTDLPLTPPSRPIPGCLHCGQCASACPGRCLPGDDRSTCVSALTQKKGALTPDEAARIRAADTVWGCDRCQEVCPLNRDAVCDPHPCFSEGPYEDTLTADRLASPETAQRAYGWRGTAVLRRNWQLWHDREDT